MKTKHIRLLTFLAVLSIPVVSNAAVVYRETFGYDAAGPVVLSTIQTAWKVYNGNSGTAIDDTSTVAYLSSAQGAPINLPNVGTGYTSVSQSLGCVITTRQLSLFETTQMTLDASQPITFSWYEKNQLVTDGFRLAIQINGSWYASDTLYTAPAGSASWVQESMTFATTGSLWRDLTFTPGTSSGGGVMSLSSTARSADLPNSNITGFGLLGVAAGTAYIRFDTFEVTGVAVPEPSSMTLVITTFLMISPCLKKLTARKQNKQQII